MRTANLLLLGLWLLAASPAPAEDATAFAKANQAYKSGDYAAALSGYREAAKKVGNPLLYLNLGNAAYKAAQPGWAILYYEKGLELDPRNPDLESNLAFAREHITDKALENTTWLGQTVSSIYHYLSLRELAIVTSFLWFLVLAVAAALCWLDVPLSQTVTALFSIFDSPKGSKLPALFIPCAALLLVFGGWSAMRLQEDSVPRAIVLEKEVKATSGPGADPTVVFAVHEGTKVTIVRRSEHWAQVVLGNGYSGWVPEESLGEI